MPFGRGGDGYEDWYLVEDWTALGELNEAAVDAGRRPSHDAAAALVGVGWAGVYGLARGEPVIPEGVRWLDKPLGEKTDAFLAGQGDGPAWRREMVLGPTPEFCLGAEVGVSRRRVC